MAGWKMCCTCNELVSDNGLPEQQCDNCKNEDDRWNFEVTKAKLSLCNDFLHRLLDKSERHIQTMDDFWVYDRQLRMELVDLIEKLNK